MLDLVGVRFIQLAARGFFRQHVRLDQEVGELLAARAAGRRHWRCPEAVDQLVELRRRKRHGAALRTRGRRHRHGIGGRGRGMSNPGGTGVEKLRSARTIAEGSRGQRRGRLALAPETSGWRNHQKFVQEIP